MRTARAARAVQLSGACVRANKERGYPSVENFWNDLNKLLSDFYKVTVYKGRWVQYLEGLGMTIALAALACLIGVCIGVLVALVKYYAGGKKSFGWKTVNAACGIYVTVIRGTPIVVQRHRFHRPWTGRGRAKPRAFRERDDAAHRAAAGGQKYSARAVQRVHRAA